MCHHEDGLFTSHENSSTDPVKFDHVLANLATDTFNLAFKLDHYDLKSDLTCRLEIPLGLHLMVYTNDLAIWLNLLGAPNLPESN